MQISTESNTEISKNTNTDNYNNRIMWMRIMSDDDVLTTSSKIKHDQKSFMNEWENKIRIICTIMK